MKKYLTGVVIAAVMILGMASNASAQAHPCDTVPSNTITIVEGTRTLGWCHADKDTNGNPANITQFVLYTGATRTQIFGVGTNAVPNAAGLIFFTAPYNAVKGTYVLQIAAINAQGEGAKSAPFTLTVTGALSAPVIVVLPRVS